MTIKSTLNSKLFIFGTPLILLLVSIFLASQIETLPVDGALFSSAITLDLVITIPIVYFLLIRKTKISNFTVMPFFVMGLIVATLVIPSANQETLDLIKTWLLPLVEITVVSLVILKVRKFRKLFKANQLTLGNTASGQLDFVTTLKKSAGEVLPPKLAMALATEIGLVYYCFVAWKKPVYTENQFSYHKESGSQAILGVLLGVALIELFCVHLLIQNSYPILSWVLTGISAYGVIQILGLMKSIPRTPAYLTENAIVIRMGLIKETTIPFEKIEKIEFSMADYPKEDKSYQRITLFDHNCILHLYDEEVIHGLFGTQKKYKHLVLSIDDKARFEEKITVRTDNKNEI